MRNKRCSHGLCNSDGRDSDKPHMLGIKFYSFPKAKHEPERLAKWVWACNRSDFGLASVKSCTYICSKHFVDPGGPSKAHPDPVLATAEAGSCRSRRKLKNSPGEEPPSKKMFLPCGPTCTNSRFLATLDEPNGAVQSNSLPQDHQNQSEDLETPTQDSPVGHSSSQNQREESVTPTQDSLNSIQDNPVGQSFSQDRLNQSEESVTPTPSSSQNHQNQNQESVTSLHNDDQQVGLPQSVLTPFMIYNSIVLAQVPKEWTPCYHQDELLFLKLHNYNVVMSVKINFQLGFLVTVFGEELQPSHPLMMSLTLHIVTSLADIFYLLEILNKWKICSGNNDAASTNSLSENRTLQDCKQIWQTSSFHSKSCTLLLLADAKPLVHVCKACRMLKYRLKAAVKRKEARSSKVHYSPKCSFRYLPMNQIQQRFRKKQEKLKSSTRKIARLKQKIQKIISREGQPVHARESEMFEELIKSNASLMNKEFYQPYCVPAYTNEKTS